MDDKERIDLVYLEKANKLESKYYKIVLEKDSKGKVIGQHRELRKGKSLDDFNTKHAEIWRQHEQALIDAGIIQPPIPPSTEPSLEERIAVLEASFKLLKSKVDKSLS